ncbi:hypothetical protein [Sphingomonas sp. J315]|uniref:hypothetical protein n=1 Tax=Sphingomonas sp. J315 TaxID=2898433 RepID=UPI0021ADE96E|nr:hypothetical protein [Sphingomonas sp. J315]UUX98005.1 hypothetical protein LRS08_10165 [Sphingomonas sp. J315]
MVDWDELGTLDDVVGGYEIRTDPLWILVTTAKQGHMGSVEDMRIRMANGAVYGPSDIYALARRSDRKNFP